MKRIIISLWFAVPFFAFGAEYAIPSSRLPATGTWQASGIPGGIPVRNTIYTTITTTGDATDRTAEIESALSACPNGEVVLLGPGTFRCNGQIDIPFGKQITLRGSVDSNGVPTTIIDSRATGQYAITTTNFSFSSGNSTATVATLTKGATSITVASTAGFAAGELVRVRIGDTADPMTWASGPNVSNRGQVAKIANSGGIPNGTTLVLDSPGLHGDYTGAPSAYVESMAIKTSNCGIENLIIDCTNANVFSGIGLQSAYRCWAYNVKVVDYYNYGAYITYSMQCEIRRCWFEYQNGYGTSTVGLLTDSTSQTLFIDNVFQDSIFAFFTQGFVSGCVVAYNAIVTDRPDLSPPRYYSLMNSNHATFNQFILFEGNVAPQYKNDGFFGGTAYTSVWRNWLYGLELGQNAFGHGAVMNRFSRYENLVGNVFGHGTGGTEVSMGNPNISNGNSNGVASMFGTKSTLTVRTNATSGTITAPSGHGITTGSTIDVYWMQVISTYNTARIRRNVTVGTVSGTSIPFSGGTGNDLPAQGAEVLVPTSDSALWAYSLDWDSSAQRPRRWTGTVTTQSSPTAITVTLGAGQISSFNAALENTVFSGYTNERGFAWASGALNSVDITNVTGDVLSIATDSETLPAPGTAVTLYPSYPGFEELDLDVIYTTILKGNYYHQPSDSGIPAVESLSGDTLASSLFLSATPSFFTDAGMTWPPVSTSAPPNSSYAVIPAGLAYINGYWGVETTVSTPQYTPSPGTLAAGSTVTITCSTSGSTIYYTTDGSTPTTSSSVYSSFLSLSVGTTVVKALGVKSGLTDSSIQSGTYVLVNVPTAPSGLGATAISTTQINLAWTDNSSTETGFRIERKVGPVSFSTVATTSAGATTYSDTGLTAATTYDYRVYAINPAGDSAASNTASATTNSVGGGGANATIQTLNVGTLNIQ